MKPRVIALIAVAVLAAHALFFWLVADAPALPKTPYVPPANFGSYTQEITDPQTGEKSVYREFTVSTKLPAHPAAADAEKIP